MKFLFASTFQEVAILVKRVLLSGRRTPESEKSPIFELIVPERVQLFGRYCNFFTIPPSKSTSPTTSLCATPERVHGVVRLLSGSEQLRFTHDISTQPAPER